MRQTMYMFPRQVRGEIQLSETNSGELSPWLILGIGETQISIHLGDLEEPSQVRDLVDGLSDGLKEMGKREVEREERRRNAFSLGQVNLAGYLGIVRKPSGLLIPEKCIFPNAWGHYVTSMVIDFAEEFGFSPDQGRIEKSWEEEYTSAYERGDDCVIEDIAYLYEQAESYLNSLVEEFTLFHFGFSESGWGFFNQEEEEF